MQATLRPFQRIFTDDSLILTEKRQRVPDPEPASPHQNERKIVTTEGSMKI